MKVHKYNLPAHWACYLINADSSSMSDEEIKQCDKATEGLGHCVECSEETFFSVFKGMGCDMLEYTFVSYDDEKKERTKKRLIQQSQRDEQYLKGFLCCQTFEQKLNYVRNHQKNQL